MFKQRYLLIALLFILIKLLTWGTGCFLATSYPFNSHSYFHDFHHLKIDNRAINGEVNFFDLWNYADSEWYLSIAQDGYPSAKQILSNMRSSYMFASTVKDSHMRYAFFPLYPSLIGIFAKLFNLKLAAFATTLLINVLALIAFLHLIKQYFPEEDAIWPFLLLFLFPFSIFYSLYFSEALFLLLSLLVFIFLKSKKYFLMAASGFLLTLTHPNGFLIVLPIFLNLLIHKEKKALPYILTFIIPTSFLIYLFFGYVRTGVWNFYSDVNRVVWGTNFYDIKGHLINQVELVLHFLRLPLHGFHKSKIDTLVMVSFGIIIGIMWLRKFPRDLTLWSTLIWAIPLITKNDLMSYSRYMSVSFPVFIFLGFTDKRIRYVLLILFSVGYYVALKTVIQYNWL